MPTEPTPIAQVNTGMRVFDAAGEEIGTVTAVKMPGTAPEAAVDLPSADAGRLTRAGYVQVDTGLLSRDLYVEAGQVANVDEGGDGMDGVVTLSVTREQVTRAG
jgi:hypothetical protein